MASQVLAMVSEGVANAALVAPSARSVLTQVPGLIEALDHLIMPASTISPSKGSHGNGSLQPVNICANVKSQPASLNSSRVHDSAGSSRVRDAALAALCNIALRNEVLHRSVAQWKMARAGKRAAC